MNYLKALLIFIVALASLLLSACSCGDEDSYRETSIILDLPSRIQTEAESLRISGEVLLGTSGKPPSIEWRATGATNLSGNTSLTAELQFAFELPIELGDTRIEIIARDDSADPNSVGCTVTRNAAAALTGALALTKDIVYVAEETTLYARIAVNEEMVVPDSVKLIRVAADGSESEQATLRDDGNWEKNGDEIQADGVFSASFTLNEPHEGWHKYRVKANLNVGGEVRSAVADLKVTARLSDGELNEILELQKKVMAKLKAAAARSETAYKATVSEEVKALNQNPLVQAAAANDTGMAISVLYKCGIAGTIGDFPSGKRGGTTRANAEKPELSGLANATGVDCNATTSGADKIGSNEVYALAANYNEWGEDKDEIPELRDQLAENKCLNVQPLVKFTSFGGGDLEKFKNFGDYGIVLFSSHGDTHFTREIGGVLQDFFGDNVYLPHSSPTQVVVFSNVSVTTANKQTYEDDLKAGRLAIMSVSSGGVYGILPSFFEKYSGKFPNSFIYTNICRGSYNNTLGNAFRRSGAATFIGYSDYVGLQFTIDSGRDFFEEFLAPDKTTGDGYNVVSPKREQPDTPASAEFRLIGSKALKMPNNGLEDGGFESNSLNAWKTTGDGRILTKLGTATAREGKYTAIISTGLGFTTASGSIEQMVCLGAETELRYQWNFFSEEFAYQEEDAEEENAIDQFQDQFTVSLEDADDASNQIILQRLAIKELHESFSPQSANISFDRTGDKVKTTGWQSESFQIPETLRGKRVVLRFQVEDEGEDTDYDSALLLDEISLN